MSLRNSTTLLILALVYAVLHKVVYGLLPSAGHSTAGKGVAAVLGTLSVAALVLFAYRFSVEVAPPARWLGHSLGAVVLLTVAVTVARLPVPEGSGMWAQRRLAFDLLRLLNALAIVGFLVSFVRVLGRGSPLSKSLRWSAWAWGASAALDVVGLVYFVTFMLTGRQLGTGPWWRPIAFVVFLSAYATTTWFLVRFRGLADYGRLAREP